MKTIFSTSMFAILMFVGLNLFATSGRAALTPEMQIYLRSSSGANGVGGAQECINNPGAWGNEFRLGNECATYGEFGFGAWVLKPAQDGDAFFRFFANFAVVYDNRTDWEAQSIDGSGNLRGGNNWVMREVYSEGGYFPGIPITAWAGKRFYRWGDVHLNDYYPVAMSGPGGGLGGLRSDYGTWSLAVIQNAQGNEINGSGDIRTNVGIAAKTTLHLRSEGWATPAGYLALWAIAGTTPPAKDPTTGTDYRKSTGGFFAAKLNSTLTEGVNNEFGMAFGEGVMSTMGPGGELVKDCQDTTSPACTLPGAWRFRSWNATVWETTKWSGQIAFMYDELNRATSTGSRFRWLSAGVRPMYWFNDHVSLIFQAGLSHIVDEADGLGSRNLMRFTIAPQLSLAKGYWSRPVVRAYYSRTAWNQANVGAANGTTAQGKTEIDSLGVQTEVWF